MWELITTGLTKAVSSFFEYQNKKTEVVRDVTLANIQAEGAQDAVANKGWKDEFLAVVFASPIIAIFYGAIFNHPDVIERTSAGVEAIGHLPMFYQSILGTIVLGTFSIRGFRAWSNHQQKLFVKDAKGNFVPADQDQENQNA
jgi:hypothetical protein